jgi:hypothetical protein
MDMEKKWGMVEGTGEQNAGMCNLNRECRENFLQRKWNNT